jgi:YVTN family beta-propeller protein
MKSLGLLALALAGMAGAAHRFPFAKVEAAPMSEATGTPMPSLTLLPGMPPVIDPNDIYSEIRTGKMSPAVKNFPTRVYVPNSGSNSVDVIDPATYKIIDHFAVGREPQHVIPSWDLKKLWVAQDLGDQLTFIDPSNGKKGETIHVDDPYNMYYTPDGKYALIMAEREHRLDFRDAQTMKVVKRVPVSCDGVNHIDYSADGRYFIATCEFSGELLKVDVAEQKVLGKLKLTPTGMPQDCKLSPDGKVFYVANMEANGVHLIDGDSFKQIGFMPTGNGTHGLYPSRDGKYLYVSNRGSGISGKGGSITLIEFATRKIKTTWPVPGGGSPDMGGVSADGKTLWLSGRYHSVVYVFDTGNGNVLAKISVGKNPHGLCYFPQPGRYSLGHTGNYR